MLPADVVDQRVHGTTGADLSAGRFGNTNASLGRIGEQRTDHLLRTSMLPTYPAMRLIHGLHWPGTDHGDIDHALLLGRTVIVIDSRMWRDGHSWWDGVHMWREGEQRPDVTLGKAVKKLRPVLAPHVQLYGVVLAHATSGALDAPTVENGRPARTPYGGHMIPVLNLLGLLTFVYQIARSTPEGHVVDARLFRRLLEQRVGSTAAT